MKYIFKIILVAIALTLVLGSDNILKFTVKPSYDLPAHLYQNYSEYIKLEEIDDMEDDKPETCNLLELVKKKSEEIVTQVIDQSNCIPDSKTFKEILDNGWEGLVGKLVKDVYLSRKIDPATTIYNYIGNNEEKIKTFSKLIYEDESSFKNLKVEYSFENLENEIKMKIKMPDFSYTPEYYSLFCRENLFIINAIFKSRNKLYKLKEEKVFFDNLEGDCTYSYNYFTYSIDISLKKTNKLKEWKNLFK